MLNRPTFGGHIKNEGAESSFPIKVHAIPGKTPAICEFLVVQMWCKNQKKNRKSLKIKDLRFVGYPEPGSNRHGLLHWCLRPARLPIPPSGRLRISRSPLWDCFFCCLKALGFAIGGQSGGLMPGQKECAEG